MKHILCFDVGGTKTRVAVVTADGPSSVPELVERTYREIPTPATIEELGVVAKSAVADFHEDPDWIAGYSLAIAASIRDHVVVRESPNVPFLRGKHGYPLTQRLRDVFEAVVPVLLVNDMEAALAGEVVAGALRGCRWGFMDTISTGWGGAMLYNGAEVAAEPGHLWVGGSSIHLSKCGCGRQNCAEGRYSGGAVRRRVLEEVEAMADARYDSSYRVPDGTDPCAFADEEYRQHEPWARLLYHGVAEAIGEIWGSRLNLCPLVEKIVYTGTFAERFFAIPDVLGLVRARMTERFLFQDQHETVPITRAEAPRGVLLGAARIFERLVNA